MTKSTLKPLVRKPTKPYDAFPLLPHNGKHWAKRTFGKIHLFGRWGRAKAGKLKRIARGRLAGALDLYRQQRDDLYAGREPVDPDKTGRWHAHLSPVGGPVLGPLFSA